MALDSLSRPAAVDCLSFEGVGDGKTCRHYSKGGVCGLAQIRVCTEWEKRNPDAAKALRATHPSGSGPSIPSPNAHDPEGPPQRRQLALIAGAPPAPADAPLPARSAHAARVGAQPIGVRSAPGMAPKAPTSTVELISTKDADDLAARGYELCVEGWDPAQEVWIVPKLTGADRIELTYTQATTLANMINAFPGSKVKVISNASASGSAPSANHARSA